MAALRTGRGAVSSELFLDLLLLFVGALKLLESGGELRRLNAQAGGLGPRTAPGAYGAAKGFIHGAHCPRRCGPRASPEWKRRKRLGERKPPWRFSSSEHVNACGVGASAHAD